MSEYQYREWQAVDRVLTLEEQDAVNDLSSHIEVSSSRAANHPAAARTAEQLEKTEKKRQAEAALQKHIAEMKALAAGEAQVWQQVETMLDTGRKIASVYDEATALLEKLNQLADFQDTNDVLRARLHRLAQKYASGPPLIDRWKKHGWV